MTYFRKIHLLSIVPIVVPSLHLRPFLVNNKGKLGSKTSKLPPLGPKRTSEEPYEDDLIRTNFSENPLKQA